MPRVPRDSAVAADAEGRNCRGGLTSPSPLLTLNGLSAWQLVLADEYVLEATFHNVLFFLMMVSTILAIVFNLVGCSTDKRGEELMRRRLERERKEKAKAEKREYSAEEVAKHSTPDDCWMVIEGKVYDVSEYVDEHPGGDAILNKAGEDATEGFKGPQHPPRVWDELSEYYIGVLEKKKDK